MNVAEWISRPAGFAGVSGERGSGAAWSCLPKGAQIPGISPGYITGASRIHHTDIALLEWFLTETA